MSEKPDNLVKQEITPLIPHPSVWWVLWVAILGMSIMAWRALQVMSQEGRWNYAGEQTIVTSIVILFLLGSVVIRWLILSRLGPTRKGFAFFVAGVAIVYVAFYLMNFFYKPQVLFCIICLIAYFQFFPLFLLRKPREQK